MNGTERKRFWLGVDVGQDVLEAAVAPEGIGPTGWRELRTRSFANTAAGLGQLAAHGERQIGADGVLLGVCVESTGPYSQRLARDLATRRPQWPAVAILNPKRVVDFGRSAGARDKNDRIDAAILAVYGAIYSPMAKPLLPARIATLRELYCTREQLVGAKTDLANSADAHDDAFARRALSRVIKSVDKEIAKVENEARATVAADPTLCRDFALLTSIRGIGFVVAWALVAELGDLRQYSRGQIVSYVGLYGRQHQSGKTVNWQPRLVKGGCRRVRKALYNAARALFRSKDNTLRTYLDRMRRNGKKPMECIVALMRKLLLIARSVLIHEIPYDPHFAQG